MAIRTHFGDLAPKKHLLSCIPGDFSRGSNSIVPSTGVLIIINIVATLFLYESDPFHHIRNFVEPCGPTTEYYHTVPSEQIQPVCKANSLHELILGELWEWSSMKVWSHSSISGWCGRSSMSTASLTRICMKNWPHLKSQAGSWTVDGEWERNNAVTNAQKVTRLRY